MKSFLGFRLDAANHLLWRGQQRVAIAPKPYDILRYLVENPGRLVSNDELLDKLWAETYVNPELIRKYILDIRKILGDRPDQPEFIETVTKRGYRFIAPVVDESDAELPEWSASQSTGGNATEERTGQEANRSEPPHLFPKQYLWKAAFVAGLLVVVAAGIGARLRLARSERTSASSSNSSVAVLPFADLSSRQDQEYFSDGLAEELIHDLAKVPSLRVVGRSSAFQFKGKNEDVREVGRKLGVANVLEGSVRREGNRVRITAELIKADDGFQLWSQTYDREITDIFAVQDEIARAATEALRVKLLGTNGQPIASRLRSANPEAYEAYLQANYFWGRGAGKDDIGKALGYVNTAIALDDKYAPAWALRASVQNSMAEIGMTDVTEGFRKARDDAERAIALDPVLAPGYLALARTQIYHDWDWDTANTCLAKAAALEPGNAEVFRARAYLARTLGDVSEGVRLYQQAVMLDPLRGNSRLGLGYMLYLAGRDDEARPALEKALELNPQGAFVHADLGEMLVAEGKAEQALAEIQKEPNDWERLTEEAIVYHALGRGRDSDAALAELIAKHHTDSAYQIAEVYAFRGESDKAFEWLDRAYMQRDSGLPEIKIDPLLKTLRRDSRYAELLKKMQLPN